MAMCIFFRMFGNIQFPKVGIFSVPNGTAHTHQQKFDKSAENVVSYVIYDWPNIRRDC